MKNKVILISTNSFGTGDLALGEKLLENFCSLLTQNKQLPTAIFCMNKGVYNLIKGSPVSEPLKELAALGVDILGCRTCIDYYKLSDEIVVGSQSSMLKFIELAGENEIITIA